MHPTSSTTYTSYCRKSASGEAALSVEMQLASWAGYSLLLFIILGNNVVNVPTYLARVAPACRVRKAVRSCPLLLFLFSSPSFTQLSTHSHSHSLSETLSHQLPFHCDYRQSINMPDRHTDDDAQLAAMGHKAELQRNFSML